jgi:tetratricopeptide (TPR) repeat protein
VLVAASPAMAEDNWIGKFIILVRPDTHYQIEDLSPPSQRVNGHLENLLYEVVNEGSDRVCVIEKGKKYWIARADAVPIDLAVEYFDKLVRGDIRNVAAYTRRGVSLQWKGDVEGAMKDLNKAVMFGPKDFDAVLCRGILHAQQHQHDAAVRDFDRAIELCPGRPQGYVGRAGCWLASQDYDKALRDLDQAIRCDNESAMSFNNRGITWNGKREYDRAIRDFDAAIRLDPRSACVRYNRGFAHSKLGKWDEAISDFDEAIRLDPKNAIFFSDRGFAHNKKREFDKAIRDLDEAIRLDPKTAVFFSNRAFSHGRKEDFGKALRDYDESLRLDANCAGGLSGKAMLLASCSNPNIRDGQKAVELAVKACQVTNWADMPCIHILAMSYGATGQFDAAIKWEEKALANKEFSKEYGDEAREWLAYFQQRRFMSGQ